MERRAMRQTRWPAVALLSVLFIVCMATARAEGPEEGGFLTIRSAQAESHYSTARLRALPQHEIVTHTAVTDGPQHFTGPLMRDLLADAGVKAAEIMALALNGDEIVIPAKDFRQFDAIAAIEMNGTTLSYRDKGPVWIVYPRDDHRELQDNLYDSRWVGQLTLIDAR